MRVSEPVANSPVIGFRRLIYDALLTRMRSHVMPNQEGGLTQECNTAYLLDYRGFVRGKELPQTSSERGEIHSVRVSRQRIGRLASC